MHQIRVHLQWLGYPIVNDPIYNHPAWKQSSFLSDDGGGQNSEVKEGSGKVSNILRVISEIVRTSYTSEKQASSNLSNAQSQRASGSRNELTTVSAVDDSATLLRQDYTPAKSDSQEGPLEASSSSGDRQSSKDADQGKYPRREPEKLNQDDEDVTYKKCSANSKVPLCSITETTESSQLQLTETEVTTDVAGEEESKMQSESDQCLEIKDPDCTECQMSRPDPTPSDLVMFLHALSYKVLNYVQCDCVVDLGWRLILTSCT